MPEESGEACIWGTYAPGVERRVGAEAGVKGPVDYRMEA